MTGCFATNGAMPELRWLGSERHRMQKITTVHGTSSAKAGTIKP